MPDPINTTPAAAPPQGGPESDLNALKQRLEAIAAGQISREDHARLNAEVAEIRTNVERFHQMMADRSASLPGAEDAPFSMSRAILALDEGRDPDDWKKLAPREWEISEATRQRLRERNTKARAVGVTQGERDTLNTQLQSEGGFLIPTEKLAAFYDIFWATLVLTALGVTKLTPRAGRVDIVKGTGAVTAYDVFEGSISGLSHTNPTFGIMEMRPREIAVLSSATQRTLALADPSVDRLLEDQMARAAAQLMEERILTGTGANGQARGVLIGAGGPSGNFLHLQGALEQVTDLNLANAANKIGMLTTGAYRSFLDFESALLDAKVPLGPWIKALSHHKVKQNFRQDQASQYTLPVPLKNEDVAKILGYEWMTSALLPTTLTKSAYTGDGTALAHFALGDWRDLIVALFGGYELRKTDVAYNPITSKSAFFGRLVHFMGTLMYDAGVIRKESIVASNEVYVG